MPTQKIFAGNALSNPTTQEQVAVLGSTAQGATVYSTIVDPSNTNTLQGASWLGGISASDFVRNPIPSTIADWDSATTYNTGNYAKDPVTTFIYISLQNSNLNNPLTDTAFWKLTGTQFLPYQEALNSLGLVTTTNIAELQEYGILPWNSQTNYNQNAIVLSPGTTLVYKSLLPNNLGNPLTNTTQWQSIGDLVNLSSASTTQQGTVVMASGSTSNTVPDNALVTATYAPLASPAFTGTPTAPTLFYTDNSNKIATTAYVQNNLATALFQSERNNGEFDCNNIKRAGTYRIDVIQAPNYPIGSGNSGTLIVTGADTPNGINSQIFQNYNRMWYRYFFFNGWTSWVEVATTAFVENVVANATTGIYFSAWNDIAQSLSSNPTKVTCTVILCNSGSYAGGSFFVPVQGVYNFSTQIGCNGASQIGTVYLYINGIAYQQTRIPPSPLSTNVSYLVQLNPTDTVELYVSGQLTSTLATGTGGTLFSGSLVSRT